MPQANGWMESSGRSPYHFKTGSTKHGCATGRFLLKATDGSWAIKGVTIYFLALPLW